MSAEIFLEYVGTVLLPYLVWLQGLGAFAAEEAVSLMDNCSAQVTDDLIRLLTESRVRVITFALHTTHIFQILDLTLFGALKTRNVTVKSIMKVYHDFTQTMAPSNVRGTFHALGLDYDTRREPSRLLFDEEKLRGSAGFQGCGRLTFSWTKCRTSDVLLGSDGSTSLNKSIWHQYLYVLFFIDRDIALCQRSKKWECGEVLRMNSWDLHCNRLFI
jgi:hypothetical protein